MVCVPTKIIGTFVSGARRGITDYPVVVVNASRTLPRSKCLYRSIPEGCLVVLIRFVFLTTPLCLGSGTVPETVPLLYLVNGPSVRRERVLVVRRVLTRFEVQSWFTDFT